MYYRDNTILSLVSNLKYDHIVDIQKYLPNYSKLSNAVDKRIFEKTIYIHTAIDIVKGQLYEDSKI